MRRWGVAKDIAKASPFGIDYPSNIHFVTRMNGYKLTSFDNAINCHTVRDDRYPEHSQWIPQYKLEQVLRDKIQELDYVDLMIGTEFLSIEQRGARVFVRARRSKTEE